MQVKLFVELFTNKVSILILLNTPDVQCFRIPAPITILL